MGTTFNKTTFAWILYDFANSAYTTLIITFIYATYFTQAIAPDKITGTALWSRGITITAIAVALLSPIMGALADLGGYRKKFLFSFTFVNIITTALLFTALPGQVYYALTWVIISNIAFEMANVFYNAYLPDIAPKEKIGRISGYGWAFGYVGGLLAMFIALIGFVDADPAWFGFSGDDGENIRATNLVVAIWFAIFAGPFFIIVKDRKRPIPVRGIQLIKGAFTDLFKTLKNINRYRNIARFLLARLIYNDGLITIFAFGGIYAAGTFNFSFKDIMIFGVVLNIAAGIGAYIMGFVDDRIGGKKTIQISLWCLIIATFLAVFTPYRWLFWVAGVMVGIFSGPNQAASRSLMGRLTPKERINEFFGFFALSGKFTAFMGPFLLGVLTDLFDSQRAGVAVVALFFILGSIVLTTVKDTEKSY
ncbi:MAG: MFS transporter [Caldithrix sp.]|nr:MFS transporter [Caldithrix sp.]